MSVRKLGVVLAAVCAALLVVPVAAGAQTPPAGIPTSSFARIPVSGTAMPNGKTFAGRFNVSQFVAKNGRVWAVGTLTGRIGNRSIKQSNVAIPVSMVSATTPGGKKVASPAATCPILHLDLGPVTLNLLGLNIHLNEVVLDITATSGPGNLLGNLLCSVANLLNPPPPGAAELAALLNILQQLLNVPGLLNL
jgi:hypothetical protein